MKKMILSLALIICSMVTVIAGKTPGTPVSTMKEEVNAKVLGAFKKEFTSAREITWTIAGNYYQASFVYNDQHIAAYYSIEGELMALTRYISPADLPLALQSNLKKNYADYWISDLFEVANEEGTTYYITLEDAEVKMVLKATDGSNWKHFKKVKKA
jgi:hypothetical protein